MADAYIISGSGGTVSSAKPIDLSVFIQLAQPTAKRAGDLWIKADIASQITSIVIDKALKANVANGTIQLIAPLDPHKFKVSQSILVASGKEVPISLETSYTATKWAVSNLSENGSIVQLFLDSYPLVYSTLNGVLDVETAYVWDGTAWVIVSQKGTYTTNGSNKIFNRMVDGSLVLNTDTAQGRAVNNDGSTQYKGLTLNAIGTVAVNTIFGEIWKRSGDVFTKIQTGFCQHYAVGAIKISDNGEYIVAINNTNFSGVEIYKFNGTSYVSVYSLGVTAPNSYSMRDVAANFTANEDCSLIYARQIFTSSIRIVVIRRRPDTGAYEVAGSFTPYVVNFSTQQHHQFARGTNLYIYCIGGSGSNWIASKYDLSNIANVANPPRTDIWSSVHYATSNVMPRIFVTRDQKYAFMSSPSLDDGNQAYLLYATHIPTLTSFSFNTGPTYKPYDVIDGSLDNKEFLISAQPNNLIELFKVSESGNTLVKVSQTPLDTVTDLTYAKYAAQYIPH